MYNDDFRNSLGSTNNQSPVQLLSTHILKGCNVYHSSTVICQEVDLGILKGRYSGEFGPNFPKIFLELFFDKHKLTPNPRINDRFLERLNSKKGAACEELLLEAILYIESTMAYAMYDFRTIKMAQYLNELTTCRTLFIWESNETKISSHIASVALTGLLDLLPQELYSFSRDNNGEFQSLFSSLEKQAKKRQKSTTTSVLMMTAKNRGIPCVSLGGPHLRLGEGVSQQIIYASVLGNTSLVASQLCRNKSKAIRRLAQLRLPVPKQIKIKSLEESIEAANKIGFPVVLKPLKGKQGDGVSVGICNSNEIPAAFAHAGGSESVIIVESFIPGNTYRLLVMGGKFVAALMIKPPAIIGDGKKTIALLIEDLNNDPLRNSIQLFKVDIDEEMVNFLNRNGYAVDDVLENKKELVIRSVANVAVGGIHYDVTDIVHEDNREMAVRAAAGMCLDVAGVDFVSEDISRSYLETGGSIIEMNARPGLCMHTFPRFGKSQNVSGAMLDLVYSSGSSWHIPTALIVGDRNTAAIARQLHHILQLSGKTTGLVTKKGTFINGHDEAFTSTQQRNALQTLLHDPRIEILLSTISQRQAVSQGLQLENFDVSAILEPDKNHDNYEYQQGIKVVIKATKSSFIVAARNKIALEMLSTVNRRRIILVSPQVLDPLIDVHLANGGSAVAAVIKKGQEWIVVYNNNEPMARIKLSALLNTTRSISTRHKENIMFGIALAIGMGLSGKKIEALLKNF